MLKLEHHELRSEFANLAQRLQELDQREAAVDSASEEIRSIEAKARELAQAEELLPLDALVRLLGYMPNARKCLRDAEATRARSEAAAAQTRKAVVGRKVRVRGVQRVHDRIAAQHALDVERALSRELDELWSYRRGTKS